MIAFRVLGTVEAWSGDTQLALGGPRQVKLLAFLLLNANRAVSTDTVIDTLWGAERDGAAKRLQMAVMRLRRAIEPAHGEHGSVLRTVSGGYLLSVAAGSLDADTFARRLNDGQIALREGDSDHAAELLRAALALWRGPALADVRFEDFAQPEIRRLEEAQLIALETRIDADLRMRRDSQVLGELDALVAEHPTREYLALQLMLALYRTGRQTDALEVYERARVRLAEELGLEPGPVLKSLHTEILRQAPRLMSEVPPFTVGRDPPAGSAAHPPAPEDGWQRRVPLPPRVHPYGPAKFVGRGTERERLSTLLGEASAGLRRAAFVTGEAGIGKTRLASEVAREAHESGFLVLAGRCDEELSVPYQPFVEALEQLVEQAPESMLAAHLTGYGDSLARLVPALVSHVADPAPARRAPSESERYVLFRAIEGLIGAASSGAPALIVLEDLHWADIPTLRLLRSMLTSPRDLAVAMLCTCRVAEIPADHPLGALVADLHREPRVMRLALGGLTTPEVGELIATVAGDPDGPIDDRLAPDLERATSGNPFFISEIVRSLNESHGLERPEGDAVRPALPARLPVSISETLGRRLGRLGEDVRRCLRVAAVIGDEFGLEVLTEVGAGLPVADTIEQALGGDLLIEAKTAAPRLRFSHALMQGYLYEQLGVARRQELHQKVAEVLERSAATQGAAAAELARHWLAAGAGGAVPALRYAALAGDDALRQLAPDEARRWYEIALEKLGPTGGGDRERCDLLVRRGEAERQAGDPRFRQTLLDAGELARQIGSDELLVQSALANTRGMQSATGVVDDERITMLQAALGVAGNTDSAARARLLAHEAAELMYSPQRDRRLSLSDAAVAVGRRLGEPEALSAVLNMRFVTLLAPESLGERLDNTLEGVAVAEALSDPLARFYAAHWRLYACLEAGNMAEARSWAARERRIAEQFQMPTTRWLATADQANLSILGGDLEMADRLAVRALELGRASEPDALACYLAQSASIAFEAGRLGEMTGGLQSAVTANPGVPGFRALLALALASDGDDLHAAQVFQLAAAGGFADLPHDVAWLTVICIYSLVACRVGAADAAPTLYGLLEPWSNQIAFPAFGVWGPVSLYAGALAQLMGDDASAERWFSEAARIAAGASAPLWEAHANRYLTQLTRAAR